MNATTTAPAKKIYATEKQVGFIVKLATERGFGYDVTTDLLTSPRGEVLPTPLAKFSKRDASALIDAFLKSPGKPKAAPAKAAPAKSAPVKLDAGMYQVGDDIFKVQAGSTGNMYAKILVITPKTNEYGEIIKGKTTAKLVYASGAIFKIKPEHRMELDTAKAFGKKYGICCCCSALLTNPISVEEGIGPVCGGRV